MRRNWKYGLLCAVSGLCCFATVAEVDAGIVFRRRPGLFPGRGTSYQTTSTVAPTAAAPALVPAATATATAPTARAPVTTTTRTRRRGILGRRRGTVVTSSQVATTSAPAMTVRGQTPEVVPAR
jgi:hypothetical protein